MLSITSRIAKLEAKHGSDMERRLSTMSEEQIETRISELTLKIRAGLITNGVDCSDMSDEQVCRLVTNMLEA